MLDRNFERAFQRRGFDRGVGGDEREHGCHSGLNHSRAFADTADPDCRCSNFKFDRDFFAARVGGHDRFGYLPRVRCRSCDARRARSNSAFDVFHRHRHSDSAGRANENVVLINEECFGREARHSARAFHSLIASASVCVSGIHHHRPRKFLGGALATDLYRRSADLVRRKHSSDRGGDVGDDHREIVFPAFLGAFAGAEFFNVAKNGGAFETARRANRTGNLSKRIFQINPAVSGQPSIRFMHWTA